ncbi:hypothetical protein [Bacteroides caecimuris]|uniref:hypothetical protein n=1 Tax=Bacteroides caecimuris TaxID=1796613 RepID=UPI001C3CB6D4|nr:hypothetical protein [Bacteroides caecimuris]
MKRLRAVKVANCGDCEGREGGEGREEKTFLYPFTGNTCQTDGYNRVKEVKENLTVISIAFNHVTL